MAKAYPQEFRDDVVKIALQSELSMTSPFSYVVQQGLRDTEANRTWAVLVAMNRWR
jgi:hypothetical protein